MGEVKEECGIAAVFCPENSPDKDMAVQYIYKMLLSLQNRGQLSAGLTTFNESNKTLLSTYKNIGSVNEVFKTSRPYKTKEIFEKLKGNRGIGHVRYATSGLDDPAYAQPFERIHGRRWKWFSFCFNGNLANFSELKRNLLEKTDYHLIKNTDTEIIMHYIAHELRGTLKPNIGEVFNRLSEVFDGSYNCAFINSYGDMAIIRDPLGIKPLCYGYLGDVFLAASESNALINCGVKEIKDLQPGEAIIIEDEKVEIKRYAKTRKKSHCMFEWVYFANVCSTMDEQSVYLTRTRLGKNLAKVEFLDIKPGDPDYIVVPVPDTAKAAGDSYAYNLCLPSKEGIIRNRHVGRTFIESNSRSNKVKNKFTVLKEVVKGKKVILVDDSIVRGNTSKNIIKYIREEGEAKEVHMRITCPPIMCPCFYGIDMSTISELSAPRFCDSTPPFITKDTYSKLAKEINADSVLYLPIHLLVESIGKPSSELCLACLNGDYPTEGGKKLFQVAKKKLDEEKEENVDNVGCKRTYE